MKFPLPRQEKDDQAQVLREKTTTALITGASSGLGLAFARLYASQGARVILVARNEERLAQAIAALPSPSGQQHCFIAADLSQLTTPAELDRQLQQRGIQVDTLVNNAGAVELGQVQELIPKSIEHQLLLNAVVPALLVRQVLPAMIKHRAGKILNVASLAGFAPGTGCAAYYAAKASLVSFSVAVAEEVRSQGIVVACLCPGPMQTALLQRTNLGDIIPDSNAKSSASHWLLSDPQTVAWSGYAALQQGKSLIIPGLIPALLHKAFTQLPPSLLARMHGELHKRMQKGNR